MMLDKILNKISFKENRKKYLNLRGILTKRYAYKGPDVVQIDLTDRCNSHCLICWIHSPFLKQNEEINTKDLDFSILKQFINEINKSGTKEIIFSGGGEPFLYSQIWEILEFTQKIGLTFRINTNFTLLNKEDLKRLLSFDKLASLVVSIWAGDADLYSILHNRGIDMFYKVKNNLRFLNALRPHKTEIRIFAVINNKNCLGLRSLINLAVETGCSAIEFGVPDLIPGATDSFLLNKEQLSFVKQELINIAKNLNRRNYKTKIINKDIFLKRTSSCRACFGEYDTFIERIPCYAGWIFLRLRANGDFNSCLKSHHIPIGNIYKDSFLSVWNGSLQQEFRKKSLSIPRDRDYFRAIGNGPNEGIGCNRICDNILVNEHLHKIIKYLFWI